MGKPMYKFGQRAKEIARQQKQIDKASKRIMNKQQKTIIKNSLPSRNPDIDEPGLVEELVNSSASGLNLNSTL
jgi:hypothetical protein